MTKAIFLDRDGVLNELVLNPNTQKYEAPHNIEDFSFFDFSIGCLLSFVKNGYKLFLVSNQPDYALGKAEMSQIILIQESFKNILEANGIFFSEYLYCYHHPDAIVPEYKKQNCGCRKPNNDMLKKVIADYNIDIEKSWFTGDQDSDINCGNSVMLKTILINHPYSQEKRGLSTPQFQVDNLEEALQVITKEE